MSLSRVWAGLFAVVSVVVALVSWRFMVAPLAVVMDHMAHYRPIVPWPLFGHIVLAPLALLLAPLQLWQGLRARRPGLHRWCGRIYAGTVGAAGVSSLLLLPQFLGSRWAATGFALLAVLWVGCTVMGVVQARAGQFAAHRRWMLRSVALTFAAVTLRVYMAPLMANGWTVLETYQVTAWVAWVPNLVVAEVWLRRGAAPVMA